MPENMSKILYVPWVKQIDQPMLLEDFREQIQKYLSDFNVGRDSLLHVSKLFGGGRDIWPDQCERSLALIRKVNKSVQEVCQLLETASQLPEAVIPFRYPLAVALCYLSEQMGELMQLITLFEVTCQPPLIQLMHQRQEIYRQFEPLLQNYDDILHKLYSLLDQVYFQERKRARF